MDANKTLKAVEFSQREGTLLIDAEREIGFMSAEGVAYLLRFDQSPDWNFDLRSLDGAFDFYGRQCADAKGAMVSLELVKVDGAFEALKGIFKYRFPENPLAMAFVGIIWVPFMEACLQINVEAFEQGMTGMREALVTTMMMQNGTFKEEQSFEPPTEVSSFEEMRALMSEKALRVIPSDAAEWDEKFAAHPLSLVRKNLTIVADSLKLGSALQALRPFRR